MAAFTIQSDPTIEWLYCRDCHAHSASHMPTSAYLEAFYTGYYDTAQQQVTFYSVGRLATHILELVPGQWPTGEIGILDFGGGDGSLSVAIGSAIHDRTGALVKITLVDYLQVGGWSKQGLELRSLKTLGEAADSRYWLVLASAVLEHVPDLSGTLQRLLGAVEPGGYLYARTPFAVPLKRVIPVYPLKFPMHLHDLGPSFWNRVPDRSGPGIEASTSRPSIVASGFRARRLARTIVSHLLKAPAFVEGWLRKNPKDYIWALTGGWEILLKKRAAPDKATTGNEDSRIG